MPNSIINLHNINEILPFSLRFENCSAACCTLDSTDLMTAKNKCEYECNQINKIRNETNDKKFDITYHSRE